jgi:phage-related protein
MSYKVFFFQTSNRRYPVKEFIESQEFNLQARINKSIRLLIDYGVSLRQPYVKKISGNIYELRIRGSIPVRIFYVRIQNNFCLLHAYKKKSQKIPRRELMVAIDRSKELI